MKNKTIPAAILVLCTLVTAGSIRAQEYYLTRDGSPAARILLPEVSGRATVFAAEELRNHIERISGARLPVIAGERPAVNEARVELKPLQLEREIEADGTEDHFRLDTRNGRLVIEGNSETAVLYGVYQVLEDLGVRWYLPGERGLCHPEEPTLALPVYDNVEFSPSFRTREVALSGTEDSHFSHDPEVQPRLFQEYVLWLTRNRTQLSRFAAHQVRVPHPLTFNHTRERQGHNLRWPALRGADLETTPERFALVTRPSERWGRDKVTKRRERGAQICFTHPENIASAIKVACEFFEKNPHILTYPLGLEDSGGICECDACIEANAGVFPPHDPNRVVFTFMDAVARGVAEVFPERKISLYAPYGSMRHPPEDMKVSHNVVAVAAQTIGNHLPVDHPDNPYGALFLESVAQAQRAGADIGIRTYSMFSGTPQPLALLESVPAMHALGARWYHCESMGRDEHRMLLTWVLAHQLWDVSRDPRELIKEFCDNYYGAAGGAVEAVIALIDDSVRRLPQVIFGGMGSAQSIMTEAVIAKGAGILDGALPEVTGVERERLEHFQDTFAMLSERARTVRAYYQACDSRAESDIASAQAAIAAFDALWKERKLGRTCSPSIHSEIVQRLSARVARLPGSFKPGRGPHVGDASREILVDELFSLAETPATEPENLFFLPEMGRFRLDIHRDGVAQGWMAPEFDDRDWNKLSTWNFFERQGYDFYDGEFWYRLRFDAPEFPEGRRIILRIGALDDGGDIYVNGAQVHRRLHLHPLAWQESFAVDVTDAIRPGEKNTIAIHGHDEFGMGGLWKPTALYTQAAP